MKRAGSESPADTPPGSWRQGRRGGAGAGGLEKVCEGGGRVAGGLLSTCLAQDGRARGGGRGGLGRGRWGRDAEQTLLRAWDNGAG